MVVGVCSWIFVPSTEHNSDNSTKVTPISRSVSELVKEAGVSCKKMELSDLCADCTCAARDAMVW